MSHSRTIAVLLATLLVFSVLGVRVLVGRGDGPAPTAAELMTGPYERPDLGAIEIAYPEAKHVQTTTARGNEQHYMVQEPEKLDPTTPILIYMHGAGGDETEGMDPDYATGTFGRLRSILATRGWVYVTARFADYEGLRKELEAKYGPRPIVLAGASQGGAQTIREAMKNPELYAGVIVMCPAMSPRDVDPAVKLTMPMYIECSESDTIFDEASREIASILKRQGTPFIYVQIPGGRHSTPIMHIDWVRALDFIQANMT